MRDRSSRLGWGRPWGLAYAYLGRVFLVVLTNLTMIELGALFSVSDSALCR
ncbi:hypothetical protein [Nonomuraea turcica]|uniref:hypothetical protein n=1 Tax=Nonomuraea sp. G32 TaxID=3067274 RepID=UPI00273B08FE|nr:hypothetical protein [Nonomuraea sp. G32]MDP4501566.1 hypothetical protein [Nonomuraea sp. G32]